MSSVTDAKSGSRAFLSPMTDLWGLGLLSLTTFVLVHFVFGWTRIPPHQLAAAGWVAYYLGFIINWPHFAASYQLLYAQARSSWRRPAFLWAAVVCPLTLGALFVGVFYWREPQAMGWMIHAMYFFVGWHYVKQTFGISLLLCHQRGYRLAPAVKTTLKGFLLSLWWMNWIVMNAGTGLFDFYGFRYPQLDFPEEVRTGAISICALAAFALVALVLRQRRRTGATPPPAAIATVLTMVIWYAPGLYHPIYFLFIPFFHSLQYLVCVAAYRRNKARGRDGAPLWHLIFALGMGLLGYLMFDGIPGALDRSLPQGEWGTPQTFLTVFVLFVNIHHYFIDNVIWRRDFGDLQLHLNGGR